LSKSFPSDGKNKKGGLGFLFFMIVLF
jgi:hypothetical protein